MKSEGKGDKPPVGGIGKGERKVDTPEIRNSFVKSKEQSGEWVRIHEKKGGRPTWQDSEKKYFFQKTVEKNEIEVYDKNGDHVGIIRPSDGMLRRELAAPGRSIGRYFHRKNWNGSDPYAAVVGA
jgi:hypothetical protein